MILTKLHAQAYGLMRLKMGGVDIDALINAHAGIKYKNDHNALALLGSRLKTGSDALQATLPHDWDKNNCKGRYYAFRRWNAALIRARGRK